MKIFVLLFLSCASLFGADEGIQVFTTTKTNSGVVLTQTIFMRDGQTNLVRSTLISQGRVDSPVHKFYHNGFLVGHISSMECFSVFAGAADCPYSLEASYRTNGGVWWAEICTKDGVVVDWFIATNGLFWPAPRSEVQNMSNMTAAISHIPRTNQPSTKNNAEMMRKLRLKMLAAPTELGLKPTQEFPRVCGVLMDWPIDEGGTTIVGTVVSLSTGDASLYTTATGPYGLFGDIGHENVRTAARSLVRVGEKHYADAAPTKDYSYPKPGRLRFYLVCYDGVRMLETDLEPAQGGSDKCSDLYEAARRVIREFLITQKQKGEVP